MRWLDVREPLDPDRRLPHQLGAQAHPGMKKALVTGSAGFVGRHLVGHLVAAGWDVDMVDIANPFPHNLDVRRFFAESEKVYDAAFHCAAVVGGRATIDGSPLDLSVNLALDQAAIAWAVRTRPRHFVYFSSSAAYPVWLQQGPSKDPAHLNLRRLVETDIDPMLPELPDAIYGWIKVTGERLCALAAAEGVKCHVFRPFSGFAEDQNPEEYPFPAFIRRALRKDRPFEIWGTGDQQRDWIHVDDIVQAVMVAVDNDLPGPYNLCTGVGTSFNTLADMVTAAVGYRPLYDRKPAAPTGVQHRVGDPTLLNTFYTPTISLQEGIDRAMHAALAA